MTHAAGGKPAEPRSTTVTNHHHELAAEFGVLMAFVRARWAKNAQHVHPELRGSGLMVLQFISRHGPITSTQIGHGLDMDKSTVSRLVTVLRELGYVQVTPSPDDKRVVLLSLSEQGTEAIAEMRQRSARDYQERIQNWNPADVQQLTELLHRFNESPAHTPPTR